jgi:hypothetical protein
LEVLEEVDESFFNFTGIDISTPNNFSIVNFSCGNFVMSLNLVGGVTGRLEMSRVLGLRLSNIDSSSRSLRAKGSSTSNIDGSSAKNILNMNAWVR